MKLQARLLSTFLDSAMLGSGATSVATTFQHTPPRSNSPEVSTVANAKCSINSHPCLGMECSTTFNTK